MEVEWTVGEVKKHLGMVDVSIIIPAYNEENRIKPTILDFEQLLSESDYSYEILVVDDGSTDSTILLIEKLNLSKVRIIGSDKNYGKGHAVKIGMLAAIGKVRLLSDADGSTPPNQLFNLIKPVLEGEVDITIGSRRLEGSTVGEKQPLYRRVWSKLSSTLIQKILLPGITDAYCGFKAYSADSANVVFSKVEVKGWTFDIEALVLAKSMELKILEIPVNWNNDDESKVKKSQFFKELKSLWEIKERVTHFQF